MKRTCFLLAAGLMCRVASLAQAQPGVSAFQQLAAGSGGRGAPGVAVPIPRAETGKPFSATATTRTSQTYLDGTNVSQTTTIIQYRDAEGRVRTETSEPGVSSFERVESIMIRDPVAGVSYRLDPAKKTAVKLTMAWRPTGVAVAKKAAVKDGRGGSLPSSNSDTTLQALKQLEALSREVEEFQVAMQGKNNPDSDIVEDLGMTAVNGIPTRGTRTTTVVPAGAIGNDREFRSVSERWFSPDLNLLVKSVSTDPRFGTTTYELTNISRLPPDPYLFQVPADYELASK